MKPDTIKKQVESLGRLWEAKKFPQKERALHTLQIAELALAEALKIFEGHWQNQHWIDNVKAVDLPLIRQVIKELEGSKYA